LQDRPEREIYQPGRRRAEIERKIAERKHDSDKVDIKSGANETGDDAKTSSEEK
jgi:hypothetical protein